VQTEISVSAVKRRFTKIESKRTYVSDTIVICPNVTLWLCRFTDARWAGLGMHAVPFVNCYRIISSVAEPHHFYSAPDKSCDVVPAPAAPAPTLIYSKPTF
jgi:hypothetical protein